jgi:acyl-CoA thioesterase-1
MCQAFNLKKVFRIFFRRLFILGLLASFFTASSLAYADTKRLMIFGDSLVAGYGLPVEDGFTGQLQTRLEDEAMAIEVINAGVSGDTSAGGLARLDWSLVEKPDYILIVLGGNDLLRGINPADTRQNLDQILGRLQMLGVQTFLAGMLAPVNLGPEYGAEFNPIYPELAKKYHTGFYPFFLKDVALVPKLNQRDGLHPNAEGVAKIIDEMMPILRPFLS